MKNQGSKNILLCALLFSGLLSSHTSLAQTEQDKTLVLSQMVAKQQQQIATQMAEMNQLEKRVNELDQPTSTNSAKIKKKKVYRTRRIRHLRYTSQKQQPLYEKEVERASPPIVGGSGKPYSLKLHGFVNQAVWYANDGERSRVFYGNNSFLDTRFKIAATAGITSEINSFSNIEVAVRNNSSNAVSQTTPTINQLFIRIAEVGVESKTLGKIYLGLGPTGSDYTAESDLSGTYGDFIDSSVQKFGGGLFFNNATTHSITGNPTVSNAFDNLDGLGRLGRLRYDTPVFAGLHLEGDVAENNQRDIALKFYKEFSQAKLMASLAYADDNLLRTTITGNTIDGSGSILLNNGLNFTIASGEITSTPSGRNQPYYVYLKPGYQAHLNELGNTDFVIDYGIFNNFAASQDRGKIAGAAVVQKISKWNSSLYLGYRLFKLNRPGTNFDNINIVAAGAAINF